MAVFKLGPYGQVGRRIWARMFGSESRTIEAEAELKAQKVEPQADKQV